eukprot:3311735-Lingulodinium_polyedra.AAC.1
MDFSTKAFFKQQLATHARAAHGSTMGVVRTQRRFTPNTATLLCQRLAAERALIRNSEAIAHVPKLQLH